MTQPMVEAGRKTGTSKPPTAGFRFNRFNGVATKYLPSYLGWRRWLEKGEEIITPQTALAAALG